jgi:hypothetical protein
MREAERKFKMSVAEFDNFTILGLIEDYQSINDDLSERQQTRLKYLLIRQKNDTHIKWLKEVLSERS